jgi:hypothetical protein
MSFTCNVKRHKHQRILLCKEGRTPSLQKVFRIDSTSTDRSPVVQFSPLSLDQGQETLHCLSFHFRHGSEMLPEQLKAHVPVARKASHSNINQQATNLCDTIMFKMLVNFPK